MRILAVAPYVPFERIPHAGGEYLLRHLTALARTNEVTLLVPGTPECVAAASAAPAELELVLGPFDLPGRSVTRRLTDAAYRRLRGCPPLPTAESLRSIRAGDLVGRARGADVVELHWPEYARFATELRRAGVTTPISVVEHDVDLDDPTRRVRASARGYRRVLGVLTAPLNRRLESRGLAAADLVLVFKPADEQVLRAAGVTTAVRVIDPWLEQPRDDVVERRAGSILFTGAMWRPENESGVLWFLNNVWPSVRRAVPDATFVVVGAGPTPDLQHAAARAGGVEVVGAVDELLPYYMQASVFVAPLFVRGGLKFKVPQAMSCGLPVVATPVAADGVVDVAPPGSLWAVTDDPGLMATRIVAALRDPDEAAAVGAAAAAWCRERYSFDRSMVELQQVYAALLP